MSSTKRHLLITCLTTAGWAFAFGLGSQILTLRMDSLGWSDTIIGLNTAIYYLGIALAALWVPGIMPRLGKYCPGLGILFSGLTLLLFPWTDSLVMWFGLRLLNGMAGAMSIIPLETWLSRNAPSDQRSRHFGYYAVALTLGGAIGIGLGVPLYLDGSLLPYGLVVLATTVASFVVIRGLPTLPKIVEEVGDGPLHIGSHFLSYGSAWAQGFLEGGLLAFLSLYLLWLGMSEHAAGGMMGVSLAGVIVFQIPVGWLADRFGQRAVLLGCYVLVLLGLTVMPFCQVGLWLAVWLFLVGAACGVFYPLGLALLGERMSAGALPKAYALYLALECIGSVMGPAIMGQSRDWFGQRSMFVVGAVAVGLVLLGYGLSVVRIGVKQSATKSEQWKRAA